MHVTLVNDTRADANPGCQATVTALSGLIADVVGVEPTLLPHGAGHQYFADFDATRRRSRVDWRRAAAQAARDQGLAAVVDRSDLLVVNLEGTFHHHTTGALALGAVMAAAHARRVPVWAVNGTVEAIDPWLLAETLAPAAHVAVREPISARWLRTQGVRATLSADCAFLADIWAPIADQGGARRVLYTPGVLARSDQPAALAPAAVVADLERLTSLGWRPTYFEMEADEGHISAIVHDRGWPVTRVADVPWRAFGSFLRQFDLVVSGRYHVLIFAAMAGVRACALPSNTWKIDGLLELLGGARGASRDPARFDARPDDARQTPMLAAMLRRCRVLARRNVTGHPQARRRIARGLRTSLIISPSASMVGTDDAKPHHVPWPPRGPGRAAETLAEALQVRRARPWAPVVVGGLEHVVPEDLPAVFASLKAGAVGPLEVVIDSAPSDAWQTSHYTVRPLALWRRLFEIAGFEVIKVIGVDQAEAATSDWTPRSHWERRRPFRDAVDQRPHRFVVTPASVVNDAADDQLRTALGLRRRADLPDVSWTADADVVFLVGTYQEFRQYLPVWEALPAGSYSAIVRAAAPAEEGSIRRHAAIVAWLQGRGIDPIVVRSTVDIDWTVWRQSRRLLVAGADSTAYDPHLWNAAAIVAARDHGFATVQMQHGIWPYADLRGPMTVLSDVVLTWSDEFRDALTQTVTWPDGSTGPRGVIEGATFLPIGCPLFDAYADRSTIRLDDLLGDWAGRYATRVLVATNLHWSQHATGSLVTPAIVDLATRMPETLFVLKPHPVHDPADAELAACPSNVVVLDEFCCLFAGLDSTRLVRAVDAVIATHSTVALEAAIAEKPCIVVDTGNPNRYEHVETVPAQNVANRLRMMPAWRPDDVPFRDHYFKVSTLGFGLRNLCRVLSAAADPPRLDSHRAALAAARFSARFGAMLAEREVASAGIADLGRALIASRTELDEVLRRLDRTWQDRQARCAAYEQQIEEMRSAQAEAQRELDWVRRAAIEDVGAFHAYCVQLEARCLELQQRVGLRERALLAPRAGRRVRIVLYGASSAGRECLALVRSIPHLDVRAFVDGDQRKWKTTVEGVPVLPPARAVLKRADAVVISSMHAAAIARQITVLGAGDRIVVGSETLQHLALRTQTA